MSDFLTAREAELRAEKRARERASAEHEAERLIQRAVDLEADNPALAAQLRARAAEALAEVPGASDARAQPIAAGSPVAGAAGASPELTAEELKVCAMTGTDPADFRAERDRLSAERAQRAAIFSGSPAPAVTSPSMPAVASGLSAEELEACRLTGTSHEDFAAEKARLAALRAARQR